MLFVFLLPLMLVNKDYHYFCHFSPAWVHVSARLLSLSPASTHYWFHSSVFFK